MSTPLRDSHVHIAAINLKRQEEGRCRHCGGPTPCWSIFGDSAPGKRHNRASYEQMLEAHDVASGVKS